MKIFIISMVSSIERRRFMDEQLTRLKLDYEFIDAVVGKQLTEDQKREVYDETWARRNEGRDFTDNEIGCALSHIKIYRKMVEEKIPAALFLEDDCWLTPSIVPLCQALEQDQPWDKFDFITLGGANMTGPALWSAGTYFIHRLTGGFFAHAYILTLNGAVKLLQALYPVRHFADCWTWLARHKILNMGTISPILATQDQFSYGSTTIVGRKAPLRRFSLPWFRYKLYRAFWKGVCRFYTR